MTAQHVVFTNTLTVSVFMHQQLQYGSLMWSWHCVPLSEGAFFVPYVIFFVCCGIPVFFLETALGQFTSEGGITCWRKICPLFEGKLSFLSLKEHKRSFSLNTVLPRSVLGIGYATQVIEAHLNVYYIVILAWAIFYLFNCFTTELPWAGCGHYWNTGRRTPPQSQ